MNRFSLHDTHEFSFYKRKEKKRNFMVMENSIEELEDKVEEISK